MLELLTTIKTDNTPPPDYPYEADTMIRIVKESASSNIKFTTQGSTFTVHYNSQSAVSSSTTPNNASGVNITVPAGVTEIFLKQVSRDVILTNLSITGPGITAITWNPKFKSVQFSLQSNPKLTTVSPYLPQNVRILRNALTTCAVFDQDISSWDVSNVTDLSYIFNGCSVFNRDLSSWNTANVTDMTGVFYNCTAYNQPLSTWKTDKVTNMYMMFRFARAFNQPLASWNTGNVTDISYMFNGCTVFNQNLSGWNVSKVTVRISYDAATPAWAAANKPIFT